MEKPYIINKNCQSASSHIKINKSPGSDAVAVEFYRLFWEDVQTLVTILWKLCEGFN